MLEAFYWHESAYRAIAVIGAAQRLSYLRITKRYASQPVRPRFNLIYMFA